LRFADRAAAWLACILGAAHLVVGHAVFVEPNERRIWFASAGFLLIVTGRARLAGHFPELEDQLWALTWAGYQGAGSPDRADAMVWAMTELFEKQRAGPRIRVL
jgi:hypothetical protein